MGLNSDLEQTGKFREETLPPVFRDIRGPGPGTTRAGGVRSLRANLSCSLGFQSLAVAASEPQHHSSPSGWLLQLVTPQYFQ